MIWFAFGGGLVLSLTAGAVARAGVSEGIAAYEHSDYAAALRELRPAAEAGDGKAQTMLGYMYDFGRGVPHDDAEAAKWYLRAAKQGDPVAQENLANMYGEGAGVPRDLVRAFIWFSRATRSYPPGPEQEAATHERDLVRSLMTPEQVREAEQLARR